LLPGVGQSLGKRCAAGRASSRLPDTQQATSCLRAPQHGPECRFSRVHMCIARPGACRPRRLGPVCVCGCIQQGPVLTNRITACMRMPALRRLGPRPICTSIAPCDRECGHLVWLHQPAASQALWGGMMRGWGGVRHCNQEGACAGGCRRYFGAAALARQGTDIGLGQHAGTLYVRRKALRWSGCRYLFSACCIWARPCNISTVCLSVRQQPVGCLHFRTSARRASGGFWCVLRV